MLARLDTSEAAVNGQSVIKSTLRRDGFTFKQFFVAHDRCAMKVGTDSVLLGAWAPLNGDGPVLDIGSGSGVLALMLAQRSVSGRRIDAVELDAAAAEQASENAAASPWHGQIRVFQQAIQQFAAETSTRYGLIVSNPPYFPAGVACRDAARATARYTDTLSHQELLSCAAQLLVPEGLFCVVLPSDEIGQGFSQQASAEGWYLHQQMAVADREGRAVNRLLMAYSRQPGALLEEYMQLRQTGSRYSPAFARLAQPFYLSIK